MYVPIAIYKNNIVLIDNMDTFALYFCSSVKQRMKQAPAEVEVEYDGIPGQAEGEEEEFGHSYSDDSFSVESHDDDDDL